MNSQTEERIPAAPAAVVFTEPSVRVMKAMIGKQTRQRDEAKSQLHYAEIKIRESKEGHFATLGRLVKYEGVPIIEEALDYAKTAGLFIACESKFVGVMTQVKPYTNKKGVTSLAHYSIYDKFLEIAKEGDQEPKSYNGYFLYKNFADHLEQYRNNSVQSFNKVSDLFDFEE